MTTVDTTPEVERSIIPTLEAERDLLTAKIALAAQVEALNLPARVGPYGVYSLYAGEIYGSVDLVMDGPNWIPLNSNPWEGQPVDVEVWRARMQDVHQVRQAFGCRKFTRKVAPTTGQVSWTGVGECPNFPLFHVNVYTPGLTGLLPSCRVSVEEVTETKTVKKVTVVCGPSVHV